MQLSNKMKELYNKIDLYDRVNKLVEKYSYDNHPANLSDDNISKVIEHFGYLVKYNKKENFFKISERIDDVKFYCHLSFKYNLVEMIFGVLDVNNKHLEGGTLSTICKLIEISNGIDKEGYMKYPRFRDYDDLVNILEEYFKLYESFKSEFVLMQCNNT